MKKLILSAALISTTFVSAGMFGAVSAAHADDDRRLCGNVQIDKWMNEEQIRARATSLGIEVREVDIDDGCYEVEGRNRDGRNVEVRFHPETGEQVSVDG